MWSIFSDEILAYLRDYDSGRDPEEAIMPFDQDCPLGLPRVEGLDEQIIAWVTSQEVGRANFYSARRRAAFSCRRCSRSCYESSDGLADRSSGYAADSSSSFWPLMLKSLPLQESLD